MDTNPYKSPVELIEHPKRQDLLLRVLDILALVHACVPLTGVCAYSLLWEHLPPYGEDTARTIGLCFFVFIYLFILATTYNAVRMFYRSILAKLGIAVALLTVPVLLWPFVS